MLLETVGKIFIHGLLFWGISAVLLLGWFFMNFILVSIGFILGFILGLALLFLAVGYVNRWLGSNLSEY